MFFKNATIYQLTQPAGAFIKALREHISPMAFRPCSLSQVIACGFVPPDGGELFHELPGALIFRVKVQERKIPAAAVRELLEERVANIEAEQARKVYRKERLTIKDEIIAAQIPHTLPVSQTITAYIDARLNQVILDTASPGKAERVCNLVRETIGGFAVIVPGVERAPSATMSDWVLNCPNTQFSLGTSCVIAEPNEGGAVHRITNEDLESEGVQELLRAGRRVTSLAVDWDERAGFTFLDPHRLRGIAFSDELINNQEEDVDGESAVFDANMAIMIGAMRQLIPDIGVAFGGWIEQGFMDLKEAAA